MLCDLNVAWPSSVINKQQALNNATECVADLIHFGYHIIALNHTIVGKVPHSLKNPIVPLECSRIPSATPNNIDWKLDPNLILQARGLGKNVVRQISRLTVVMEDVSQISSLTSAAPAINTYTLLAIVPQNEKLFQAACMSIDCDIISLDFSQRLQFVLRNSTVNAAISRGIVFEVSYAAALRDPSTRRNIITNASNLVRVTGGRNIIFTSAATKALETRNPYDVINLGCLFGLDLAKSKDTISVNCRMALFHAESRVQTYRSAISSQSVSELLETDTWKATTVQDLEFGGSDFVMLDDMDDSENEYMKQ